MVAVDLERSSAALRLRYRVTGDVRALRLPPPAAPGRADELWKHTCFEAFVAPTTGEAYCEVNVAPSGLWATYRFDGYRRGMAPAAAEAALQELSLASGKLTLRAQVDLAAMPELGGDWRVGLTAVIETTDGALSYWSVAHPPGRPDFHHRDCLALELPAPQGS